MIPVERRLQWGDMGTSEPPVELWVDDHLVYESGVVLGYLGDARIPLDPHPGDFVVVGDDEVPPSLAEVLDRNPNGELKLRLLPGRPDSHPEFRTRRVPTLA